MTPEKKRKLRNIALLSLLGLIGGTMAFQAFNQQAINDRENTVQVNVGGRVFTMAGEEYLYLENQGSGNHMIIRHEPIRHTSFNGQPQVLSNWFSGLDPEVQDMVQPVFIPAVVPGISDAAAAPWTGDRWLPAEWEATRFDTVRADRTAVNSSGTPQAFALSFADVVHLSTETGPFPNPVQRAGRHRTWWWLRTPSWLVQSTALGVGLHGDFGPLHTSSAGGNRPAIIVHQ